MNPGHDIERIEDDPSQVAAFNTGEFSVSYPISNPEGVKLSIKDESLDETNIKEWLYAYFSATAEEIFLVKTKKIFFIVGIMNENGHHYAGSGYAIFEKGETLQFSINADNKQEVTNKCHYVSRRIARVYNGDLQHKSYKD